MLVSVVGSPCSGKTSAAAAAFVMLKNQSFLTEFVPEQARLYIARRRRDLKLKPDEVLHLTDEDQLAIMKLQLEAESLFLNEDGIIVVSDSSVLNTLLYMSDDMKKTKEVQELIRRAKAHEGLVVRSAPLPVFIEGDPNRIHTQLEAVRLDSFIDEMMQTTSTVAAGHLRGDAEQRADILFSLVIERLMA